MNISWHEGEGGLGVIRFRSQTGDEEDKILKMMPEPGFKLQWERTAPVTYELRVVPDSDGAVSANYERMGVEDLRTIAAESGVDVPATANKATIVKRLKEADIEVV